MTISFHSFQLFVQILFDIFTRFLFALLDLFFLGISNL